MEVGEGWSSGNGGGWRSVKGGVWLVEADWRSGGDGFEGDIEEREKREKVRKSEVELILRGVRVFICQVTKLMF